MHTAKVNQLTETFQDIAAGRMQGLPVMNDSLQVEPVGFTPWAGHVVGILIAPWFMNLLLLPGLGDDWSDLKEGSKALWELPSGDYEFTVARLESVGVYQSCALFSSVLDFPDQETARAIAETIMRELFADQGEDNSQPAELPQNGLQQERIYRRRLLRRTLGRP